MAKLGEETLAAIGRMTVAAMFDEITVLLLRCRDALQLLVASTVG